MIDAMGGKCQCCGYDKCNNALAFHHIDPTQKDLSFGGIRANPTAWPNIVNELRKSILVCHNCHSEIHAGIRKLPTVFAKFDEAYLDYRNIGKYDSCPQCGEEKKISNRYCSLECAGKSRHRVDWDSIDLLALMKIHTISELKVMLNVSDHAIYKRRNKLLKLSKLVDIV